MYNIYVYYTIKLFNGLKTRKLTELNTQKEGFGFLREESVGQQTTAQWFGKAKK
jgi:hypothetical protein